ncbi:MAG TPA: NADPH-dependent FMN reductase [Alphaproteobacteria bacterium]|nr:NADPH-dependent FMN reductase [Alphaproteobacteria bacterium]
MADGSKPVKVLGICGSLRRGSYNRMLLRVAQEVLPPAMTLETFDIAPIPLYNEDVRQAGFPKPVEEFRSKIAAADALLFVTPEYNYSIPGVLKNAIDWASRPPGQPFEGKPAAVMGASMGTGGTVRSQYHLRQSLVYLDVHFLNRPEIFVAQAHTKFDEHGKLKDETALGLVKDLMAALAAWARRLRGD